MPQPLLLIYAKNPLAHQVKTRMARHSSGRFARRAYQALLRKTVAAVAQHPNVAIAFSPNKRHGYVRALAKQYGIGLVAQPPGALGQRMSRSLRQHLRRHSGVTIIGSDCPSITVDTVQSAENQLSQHPYSLVAADDGGYVLISSRDYSPLIFQTVSWSSTQVLTQTKRQLRRAGKTCYIDSALKDIDSYQDWKKARRNALVGPLWHARRTQ